MNKSMLELVIDELQELKQNGTLETNPQFFEGITVMLDYFEIEHETNVNRKSCTITLINE